MSRSLESIVEQFHRQRAGCRFAVTGANGFVGRKLCQTLLDHDFKVTGIVRSRQAAETLPSGVQPKVVEQPFDQSEWEKALCGGSRLIHLIARTHCADDTEAAYAEYRSTNVDLTRVVMNAAARIGVERVVYMSSIKAVGEGCVRPYRESDDCHPQSSYGETKLEAENLIRQIANEAALEWVILRPPLVYGPRAKGNLQTLESVIRKGIPLPLGRANASRSLIELNTLVESTLLSAIHPAAGGNVYHVADPSSIEVRELVRRIASAMDKPARLVPIPQSVLMLAGRLLRCSDQIRRLTEPLLVATDKIQSQLDWAIPDRMESGLQAMVASVTKHSASIDNPSIDNTRATQEIDDLRLSSPASEAAA